MRLTVTVVVWWSAVVLAAPYSQQPASQQPLPAFRSGVDVVQMDVSVLDKNRRPVRGLTAADFTVVEDGVERPIVAFTPIDLPRSDDARPVSGIGRLTPDVTSNSLPPGRIVVFLMDYEGAPGAMRITAQRIGERLLDGLGPGDLAAVGHTMFGRPQNLTRDRALLGKAIESSMMGTTTLGSGFEQGVCQCGACRLDAITHIANALRDEPSRRKAVFYVGTVFPLGITPTGQCYAILKDATERMLRATHAANVAVHALDPAGLEVASVGASERRSGAEAATLARQNRQGIMIRHGTLRELADQTGGRAIVDTNGPQDTVRAILDESSSYYLLAFQRTTATADGRFHPITVKVNRPGVDVRARKGYYALPSAAASPSGADGLTIESLGASLLPDTGLPLAVSAAPFRAARGNKSAVILTVAVEADRGESAASRPPQTAGAAPALESIEIVAGAFPVEGKGVDWNRQRFEATVPKADDTGVSYESVSTLELTPGPYAVRIAVRHANAGVAGSVHAYVEVPDFNKERLSLSGIVLHDRAARVVSPPDTLGGVLASPPTARRRFAPADRITAAARVYQADRRAGAVSVSFRVLDRDEREVQTHRVNLEAGAFANGAADVQFDLPLGTLPPGSYALVVEASRTGATARRDVLFTVR